MAMMTGSAIKITWQRFDVERKGRGRWAP